MNTTAGVFVAVNRLGGPPNRPPCSPDLFCLIAATSKACASASAISTAFMRPILVGLRWPRVIDHEDVDSVAGGFELQAKLIAERLEDGWTVLPLRGVHAQILRHPLHLPVERPREARLIDDRPIEGG